MERKFITVQGMTISYLESNPGYPKTLFFIHGNSSSARIWRKQFVPPISTEYRLIAVDLPGHGESEPAFVPERDYSFIQLGRLIATVIEKLCNDNSYILIGLSVGTNIIAESLSFGVAPKGIVLISPTIWGGAITPSDVLQDNPNATVLFKDDVNIEETKKAIKDAIKTWNDNVISETLDDFVQVKLPFRSSLFKSILAGENSDEIALLKVRNLPLLIIVGIDEKNIKVDYLNTLALKKHQGKVFKIANARHFTNIDQSEQVNELIYEYSVLQFK